ncbi:hypothetical protein EDB80DRAFT_659046 [Ilyonectria destructans]|nr:hypothetical protein EDB80DRAFT_659046 [Ilyonectria destructans]
MRNPEYLTNLGLFVDQEAQVLICFRDECEYALCVKGSRVTTHLRDKHNIPEEARKGLTRFLKTLPQPSLRDPDKATPRADGSPEHDLLRVYDGFACSKCGFRTISLQSMRRHFSDPLSSQCPNYVTAQGRRDIDELFEYVFLQTWATGPNREYWIIERHGSLIRPVDSQDIQDHLRSVLEREHNRDQGSSDMSLEQAGPISTALTFAEQRPWIERTGWDETYKDSDRREVLAALIEMPSQSQGQAHILGRRSVCGLGGDLLSPADDEWKIAAILNMVDTMLDRCEETARKTSRSILCWLRSNRALSTYPKPFTLVRNLSTTRKYRLLFKRCIALEFRAYRMSRSIRESVAGIKLNRKQLRFLERIWNHESWVVFGSDGLHKTLPYPQHEYVIGDDVNCSEDGGDDEDDDDDDDDVEEDDQEEDGDEEFLTEEDEEDLIAANQGEDTVIEGSPDELLELLLGLSLALATEPLIDGQPSSTVLIYFSGILGFSQRSKAFLPARSYTPHLSGLIYVLRLLFLERALPLRAYPTLGITRRPRIKQLERLEPIRKRYMVMGSQSPFEELISLRNFGRVMSQSDTPPFLLRWSDDGQKISLGDKIEISMGQFRLLPEHFIEEATRLCTELMFGWDPAIDFARIKDDIANHENGFSFVLHPENKLDKAYLELCDRACKARRNALFRRDSWDWSAIFRYFKKEEAFRGAALGCLDCAGGQKPRCSELLSLYCVNGEFVPRGIYIYNRSMMYVVRHHKAKRSTNREFIVARFLPAQVGFLLYKYLVYVRPFVDMLHRERRDGLHTGGTGSPLLFRLDANLGSKPWQTGRLTAILKAATLKVWGKSVNSQQFRHLCIGITEKHVRESGHRPLQRASTYGLDGAFPTKLKPQLLELYQWASSRWHEFLHLPSHGLG